MWRNENLKRLSSSEGMLAVHAEGELLQKTFNGIFENPCLDRKYSQKESFPNIECNLSNVKDNQQSGVNSQFAEECTIPSSEIEKSNNYEVDNYKVNSKLDNKENPCIFISSENSENVCLHGRSSHKKTSDKSVSSEITNVSNHVKNINSLLSNSCDLYINVKELEKKQSISSKELVKTCKIKKNMVDHHCQNNLKNRNYPSLSRSASLGNTNLGTDVQESTKIVHIKTTTTLDMEKNARDNHFLNIEGYVNLPY